jgi:hypothetical protein
MQLDLQLEDDASVKKALIERADHIPNEELLER